MRHPSPTRIPHIVVAGGGFGGIETILQLRRRLDRSTRVTLVSTSDQFLFKPYLTYLPFGVVPDRIEVNLPAFAETHGVSFVQGRVRSDGPRAGALEIAGQAIPYDLLVIATGARFLRPDVPGLSEYALVVGDQGDLLTLRSRLQDVLEKPESPSIRRIVLVAPPGSHWCGPLYELAFMLETWLRWRGLRGEVTITFATSEASFMEAIGSGAHEAIEKEFAGRQIEGLAGRRIRKAGPAGVEFADGLELPFDLLLTTGHCSGFDAWQRWPVDANGFLKVDPFTRQVIGSPHVFAVGDASNHPIKQACQALFQADIAADQIACRLTGQTSTREVQPRGFWILEQLDQGLLFQPSLDERNPQKLSIHTLSVGDSRRFDLGHTLAQPIDTSNPLFAGLLWKGLKSGLRAIPFLSQPDAPVHRAGRDHPEPTPRVL